MYSFDCVAAAQGVLQPCCVTLTRCQRPAGAEDTDAAGDTSVDSVAVAPAPTPGGVSILLCAPCLQAGPAMYTLDLAP